MLKVEKFVVNPLQENSFVVSDESGQCIFIDPGFYFEEEYEELIKYIKENKLNPVLIANTHCHFDHIMGVEYLRTRFNIPFNAHPNDKFWIENAVEQGQSFGFSMKKISSPDVFFEENDELKFGNTSFKIIHVPGHSPGHVVFYSEAAETLIAGDVLFYGSIGRSDLPGGNHGQLVSNIKNKLFPLPDATRVYCGHGPETTIGFEKKSNPFLT